MKNTKTRTRVKEILSTADKPLSAYDIFEILKDEDITLSSIYRTLDAFDKADIVTKEQGSNATNIYTLHSEEHCHYLECKSCHKKIKLDYCPYHKVNAQIKSKTDFEIDEHNVVLYGICKDCRNK